ncbi:MAG: TRAP transporter substrate-binding protein DctP [Deltaproteobacteria bacterium]|nr:TRAP transporter substrate-binding protein DctP [Deltaproteobacteria bacterium]
MKKVMLYGFLAVAFLASLLVAGPALAADPVVKCKVQTPWPPALWQHKAAQVWAEDIFKISGGRMKIDLFATGEIVPAFEIFNAVQRGTLDAGHTWAGYVIGKYPAATLVAATPAFFDLLGYWTWMQAGGGKELWQEIYGDKLKVFPAGMLWAEGGGWANKMIQKLSDFKGLKYRTVLIWGQILSEAGASVVTLPAGEIVPSLQRGTLDAAEFSTPVTDLPLGFHEVAKYWYFPGLHQIAGFQELLVNNKKWDALPADLKEVVKAACETSMARSLTRWLLEDCKAVQKIKAEGKVTIVRFPKAMQQDILERFVKKYDAQKDPMFQKVWKSQKELMKIYNPYMKLQSVDAEVEVK